MIKVVYIILFFVVSLNAMNQKELAVAIDHAVRQSVRTQKITKEALLIKMGIETQENRKNLQFTIDMLNRDLAQFLGEQKGKLPKIEEKKLLKIIKEFKELWQKFYIRAKRVQELKFSDDDIRYLANNNMKLLLKNRTFVLALVKKHKSNTKLKLANDIKIAGKQRMLVQMISKDILLYINGINKKETLKDLKKITEVDRNFEALLHGDKELKCIGVNLPKIVNKINTAKTNWQNAKPLITKALKKQDKSVIKDIIKRLDIVRVNMRQAVVLYTKSLNREKQFIALNGIIDNYYKKKIKTKHLIDLAGKQRMLSQRIAKLAIECSYNLAKDSCSDMQKDANQYSNVLNLFILANEKRKFEPNLFENIKDEIYKIKKSWEPFNKNILELSKTHDKNSIALKEILATNNNILNLSNELVQEMLKYYNSKLTDIEQTKLRVINIAGKERMLSQKMTKEFLEANILKQKSAKESMKKTLKLYSLILNILQNGNNKIKIPKVTNFEIKKRLNKLEELWSKVKPIYQKKSINQKDIKTILIANNILLKKANEIVKLITITTDY